MTASPITPALIRKVAEGLAGTTASVVIEAGRVRLIVVANGAQTVLPSPDDEDAARLSCDEAFGARP
jgi:hypothetical protein